VEGLTFLVLSDMQFDQARGNGYGYAAGVGAGWEPHLAKITKRFAEVGVKLTGQPYPVPHMVFWNLAARPTSGFEATFDTPGVTMLSGFGVGQLKDVLSGRNLFTSPLVKLFQTLNAPHFKPVREAVALAQAVQKELVVPEGFVAGRYGIPEELLEPFEVIPDSAAESTDACPCGSGCKCGSDCPCRTGGKCNGGGVGATGDGGCVCGDTCKCGDSCKCGSGCSCQKKTDGVEATASSGKWFGFF